MDNNVNNNILINVDNSNVLKQICTQCKEEKNLFNFHKDCKGKMGVRHICKKCTNINVAIYSRNNKDKKNAYARQRMINDPVFKITKNLRNRIRKVIKNNKKADRSINLLGCSAEEAKKHIESQFQEGMSWKNHGLYGWHIDHIKPCSSFDLSNFEEQKACFHYTNLQPLWAKDNLTKSDKYTGI